MSQEKNDKRAARFLDQRIGQLKAKGNTSVSLYELQAGFRGYMKAMEKKEAKRTKSA